MRKDSFSEQAGLSIDRPIIEREGGGGESTSGCVCGVKVMDALVYVGDRDVI